jgi:hypothetical protein
MLLIQSKQKGFGDGGQIQGEISHSITGSEPAHQRTSQEIMPTVYWNHFTC